MSLPAGVFTNIVGTPSTPQFAEMVINGTTLESNGSTKPCIQVMHFRSLSPVGGGAAQTLAQGMLAVMSAELLACCSADYTLVSATCKFIDDPLAIVATELDGGVGTVSTDRKSSLNSVVVRKLTTIPSRSYRGSMHFGAVPESFTTKDILNGTGTTAYGTLVTAFGTLVSSGLSDGFNDFFPVVLSSILSDRVASPSVFTGANITAYFLNTVLGSMVRRKQRPPVA